MCWRVLAINYLYNTVMLFLLDCIYAAQSAKLVLNSQMIENKRLSNKKTSIKWAIQGSSPSLSCSLFLSGIFPVSADAQLCWSRFIFIHCVFCCACSRRVALDHFSGASVCFLWYCATNPTLHYHPTLASPSSS